MSKILWEKLRWPEFKEALKEDPIIIIPVGSTEQHGPALPVCTDTADCEAVAHRAAEKLEGKIRVLVTPSVWTGYSWHHMDYPGTITLDYETLGEVVYQICRSILKHGFKRILILNGHGGNDATLAWTVDRLAMDFKIVIPRITHWDLIIPEPKSLEIIESRPAFGQHPGEYETSLSWAVSPEYVNPKDMEDFPIKPKSVFLTGGRAVIFNPLSARSRRGAYGSNSLSTMEKGQKLLNFTVEKLVEFLTEFKTWNVEDVSSLYVQDSKEDKGKKK